MIQLEFKINLANQLNLLSLIEFASIRRVLKNRF